MRTFFPILIGAVLIALSLAEEDSNKPYPPTPPRNNLRALKNDNDLGPEPECTANTTYNGNLIYSRNGLIATRYRWKEFDIYPDPSFSEEDREKISDAMWYLDKVLPCIEFGIWRRNSRPFGDYVHIKNYGGCSSFVGRLGGVQEMTLGPGCLGHHTILHELIHALGFEHEHGRPDRDDFVNIHWENIKDGHDHNFEKLSRNRVTTYSIPYNTKSIMHYSSTAFSKNDRPIITDKAGRTFKPNRELEESDKMMIKKMYDCE